MPIPEMPTQRRRDVLEFTRWLPVSWYSACVCGKRMLMIGVGDGQDSELEDASGDHNDVADEDGMVNSRLRFKVLTDHNDRSVAAMTGRKDVTVNTVRFVCDRLETWRFGVYSLKCQNGTADHIAETLLTG